MIRQTALTPVGRSVRQRRVSFIGALVVLHLPLHDVVASAPARLQNWVRPLARAPDRPFVSRLGEPALIPRQLTKRRTKQPGNLFGFIMSVRL